MVAGSDATDNIFAWSRFANAVLVAKSVGSTFCQIAGFRFGDEVVWICARDRYRSVVSCITELRLCFASEKIRPINL